MSSLSPPTKRAKLQPGGSTNRSSMGGGTAGKTAASSTATTTTAGSNNKNVVSAPSTSISDDSLKYRLSMGAATSKGGRGSLARCAIRLLQHHHHAPALSSSSAADKPSSAPRTVDATTKDETIRELHLLRIEMTKMYQMLQRLQRETVALDHNDELPDATTTAPAALLKPPVADLRHQLTIARQALSCQHEYETLAKLITNRHGASRKQLQNQVDALEKDIQSAQTDKAQKQAQLKIRNSQCQWMLQSILDLRLSLSADPATLYTGSTMALEPDNDSLPPRTESNEQKAHKEEVDKNGAQDMEECEEGEEEDEQLYGDL